MDGGSVDAGRVQRESDGRVLRRVRSIESRVPRRLRGPRSVPRDACSRGRFRRSHGRRLGDAAIARASLLHVLDDRPRRRELAARVSLRERRARARCRGGNGVRGRRHGDARGLRSPSELHLRRRSLVAAKVDGLEFGCKLVSKDGETVCVRQAPWNILWAATFHPPRSYAVVEAEEPAECGTARPRSIERPGRSPGAWAIATARAELREALAVFLVGVAW